MEKVFEGECLCSASRYQVSGSGETAFFLCHCSRCRKESGSAFGASIFAHGAVLTWSRGGENLRQFHLKGTRKNRVFCMECGSPLPRREGANIVIPAGSLDVCPELRPTARIHVKSKAKWEDNLDHARAYDGLPE